jgi:ribonuclease III
MGELKTAKHMQLALIHSSAKPAPGENNERLEFLGDSVLDMLAAQYLYNIYPSKSEGFLAGARAELVCTDNLARTAERINLGARLILGGSCRIPTKKMLADAVEAQIGAMYLTYGMDTTRQWVTDNILGRATHLGRNY